MPCVNWNKFNSYVFAEMPNITWIGGVGFYQLGENRLAKLVLSGGGCFGEYRGYTVSIINKVTGLIDKSYIDFNDVMTESDRIDGRQEEYIEPFHIKEHCIKKSDRGDQYWYIARPCDEAVDRYKDAVLHYILMFT